MCHGSWEHWPQGATSTEAQRWEGSDQTVHAPEGLGLGNPEIPAFPGEENYIPILQMNQLRLRGGK